MAFVSSIPKLFANRYATFRTEPASCSRLSRVRAVAKKVDDSLVCDSTGSDSTGSDYLRSLYKQLDQPVAQSTKHIDCALPHRNTNAQLDIWDSLVDDSTAEHQFSSVDPESQQPNDHSVDCGTAKLAGAPSNAPKPRKARTPDEQSTLPPVMRKRGRPKGSKNKSKPHASQQANNANPTKPSAVPDDDQVASQSADTYLLGRKLQRERATRIQAMADDDSPLPPRPEDIDLSNVQLHAPNGLPEEGNEDLIQELLPILAWEENERNRVPSKQEADMKEHLRNRFMERSSIHRENDRLNNLKPFKTRKESEITCDTCSGTGMVTCPYCKGEGFVDLGPNGEKFKPKFRNNTFTMPKHVMGNIYHCPLCGGLQRERCEYCLGSGDLTKEDELLPGSSSVPRGNAAYKPFDMDEFIAENAERIEIGLDGLVIMRAKKRTRKKSSTSSKSTTPKRRGRPPKVKPSDDLDGDVLGDSLSDDDVSPGGFPWGPEDQDKSYIDRPGEEALITSKGIPGINRPLSRTTDFVNTTDYQVGQKLRSQKTHRSPAPNVDSMSNEQSGSNDSRESANEEGSDWEEESE